MYIAELILNVMIDLHAMFGGPVQTADIAAYANCAPRTARKYAVLLEREGVITRPSPRGGWLPA